VQPSDIFWGKIRCNLFAVLLSWGENGYYLLLYVTTKHVFKNFGGQLLGCPLGCGPDKL